MEARRADLSRFVIRKSMTSGSDADGGHPSAGCVMAAEPLEPNGAERSRWDGAALSAAPRRDLPDTDTVWRRAICRSAMS